MEDGRRVGPVKGDNMKLTPSDMQKLLIYGFDTPVERVEGPFPSLKSQFVYKLDNFPLRRNKMWYRIINKQKEETYVDEKGTPLVPGVTNAASRYGQYIQAKRSVSREIYLKPTQVVVTERMREKGIFKRYFAHYLFDTESTIFEIIKQDFESLSDFYQKVSLDWTLVGSRETVKMKNERVLEQAEGILIGMSYFLDPLEFYEEETSREEQVTGYLARLKSATESSISIDKKSKRRKIRRKLERAAKSKLTSTVFSPGGEGEGAY
jgi:Cft2 family RNA processing exonuclease